MEKRKSIENEKNEKNEKNNSENIKENIQLQCHRCNEFDSSDDYNVPFLGCEKCKQDICKLCHKNLLCYSKAASSKQHEWQHLPRNELDTEEFESKENNMQSTIYCLAFHPCTPETQEISCKFCYQKNNVFFCRKCDTDSVKNRLPCNDQDCKELYQMEISLMKYIFSRLISAIRLNNISLSFFMSDVEPALKGLKLVSDSDILQIVKTLYCNEKYGKQQAKVNNLSRYEFDDNVFDLMKYKNRKLRFAYRNKIRLWIFDNENTHSPIRPTLSDTIS